jgi:hypothetical protein
MTALNSWGTPKLTELKRYRQGFNLSNYYIRVKHNSKWQYEHIVLAEKALGRPLPQGAVVHHTLEPWDNHGPFKLVICPSQAYHKLLHRRMKELGK